MSKHAAVFTALSAPFEEHELQVRPGRGGRQVPFASARAIMSRLDRVVGPENWWDDYEVSTRAVLCRLTIRLGDASNITRCDAAALGDKESDPSLAVVEAFGRAAAKFGMARDLEARVAAPATSPPPTLPEQRPARPVRQAPAASRVDVSDPPPRSGRALFAWTRRQDENNGTDLLGQLNTWAKGRDFPGRMIEWSDQQVSEAYAEALRLLDLPPRSPNGKGRLAASA
jgi:hypothetical protein